MSIPATSSSGRLMTAQELLDGDRLVVLDEPLAFKLFPTTDAVGRELQIGAGRYEVIGVVRYQRAVGEYGQYQAYIPYASAAQERLPMETVEACGVGLPHSGASRTFEDAAGNWQAGGTFIDTDKEAMRGSIIARVLAVALGMYLILYLLRRLNGCTGGFAKGIRLRLKTEYFRSMLPSILPRAGLLALGYAALLAAAYGILTLAIEPMYVFTEWIPRCAGGAFLHYGALLAAYQCCGKARVYPHEGIRRDTLLGRPPPLGCGGHAHRCLGDGALRAGQEGKKQRIIRRRGASASRRKTCARSPIRLRRRGSPSMRIRLYPEYGGMCAALRGRGTALWRENGLSYGYKQKGNARLMSPAHYAKGGSYGCIIGANKALNRKSCPDKMQIRGNSCFLCQRYMHPAATYVRASAHGGQACFRLAGFPNALPACHSPLHASPLFGHNHDPPA